MASTAGPSGREMQMLGAIAAFLRCPRCHGRLDGREAELVCSSSDCHGRYPVANGIPILIDDRQSLYRASDIAAELKVMNRRQNGSRSLGSVIRSLTPSISRNVKGAENLARLARLLPSGAARVLVIGYGKAVAEAATTLPGRDAEVVHSSVLPDADATLISDPHDLPFEDGIFDAVIARGVLHKVLNPWRCAEEIHRVLKPSGLIYAETPFMQQIHQGTHDFYRFTHLGHRYVFRRFEEITSGAASGPGMAAAWSWRHYLWSFGRTRATSLLLRTIADFMSFFWKFFDDMLVDRPRALDAACSVYFLGRRSESVLTDRELVLGYRGAEIAPDWLATTPRSSNEVFSQWAATGRDEKMSLNHTPAVEEMLAAAFAARGAAERFTAIDAGCGNGWVVRLLRARDDCLAVTGVDHSATMIAKARAIDPDGDYVLANLLEWAPREPVDLVHSMEVLYYFEDPVAHLELIRSKWLRPGGWAVFGIDHYVENTASLGWPTWLGVRMTTWPEHRWRAALEEAGFTQLHVWHAARSNDSPGTLAMLARAPQHEGPSRYGNKR
jgi:SAM-dependent methyltransferase/uncharacterized protein YbaR (Trm112 family)